MQTYLDCIPCFYRQLLEGSKMIKAKDKDTKKIIDDFSLIIKNSSLKSSPPEIIRHGYSILRKFCPFKDPYLEIKRKSNNMALKFYKRLKTKVHSSKDLLLTAIELAISGNIIDFGVKNNLNVKEELKKIFQKDSLINSRKSKFQYAKFKRELKKAKNILYLGDNAGEIVFDRIFIETIKKLYPEKNIIFAVKEKPVINDVLIEDAIISKIDKVAKVIKNGSDAPGTVLKLCSKEFHKYYKESDLIISKGQGNFESLHGEDKKIFFLFRVKCKVVSEETKCKIGESLLIWNEKGVL